MTLDLTQHLIRQMVFSRATFGPGARTNGVLDHITKEVEEVRASFGSADEWVDLVILSLDGLTRQLWAASQYKKYPGEIAYIASRMIDGKQSRNELRDWPDWRTAAPDKAIEHDRSGEDRANTADVVAGYKMAIKDFTQVARQIGYSPVSRLWHEHGPLGPDAIGNMASNFGFETATLAEMIDAMAIALLEQVTSGEA